MKDSKKHQKKIRILSLEDSIRDFELIQELLIDAGYQPEMTRVQTGPAFEAALHEQTHDIILADFNLPEYDAYSALEKSRQVTPDTPFMVVSGAIGEETAIELIKLGAVDYVLKDRPKRLISAIERALEEALEKQARSEAEQALQDNLALLRIAGKAARFGGWSVGLESNICTWSDEVAEIHEMPHGYAPPVEEGINFYAPEWREKITEVYTRCAREGVPYDEEMQILTRTGRRVWVRIIGEAIRDEGGTITHVHGAFQDITQGKQLLEEQRKSDALFISAFENAAIGMTLTALDGSYIRVNPAYCQMMGYSKEELLQMGYQDITHPEDLGTDLDKGESLIKNEKHSAQMIKRQITKSGQVIWVSINISLVRDADNQPLYFTAQIVDITDRIHAEQALRDSKALFASAFEEASIGMTLTALDGSFIRVNPAYCQMMGYSKEEMLQMRYQDCIHPDDLDKGPDNIKALIEGKLRSVQAERRYLNKSGRVVWVSINLSLVRDADNQPLYYTAQIVDITDRKQAEQALRTSEALFASAFEDAAIGMNLSSPEGRYIKVNQALCEMLGYSPEELVGITFEQVTHPEDLPADQDQVKRLLAGEFDSYQLEKRYLDKEGSVIWALISVSLVRDGEGKPLYAITQVNNITEQKHAQEKLATSEAQLRALFENMNDVVFTMDRTGQVLYFAPTRYSLLVSPPEEQSGKQVHEILPTEQADYQLNLAQQALDAGDVVLGEYALSINNQDLWFACSVSPLSDDTVMWISHDITERKQAEQQLVASEAELRALFAGMESVVIMMDKEGRYLRFAPTKENLLLGSPEEQIGKTCHEVLPQAQADFQLNTIHQALTTGEVIRGEYPLTINGREVWFAATASPLSEETVLWMAHDITERKEAEIELQRRESLLNKIFEVLPTGLWFADAEGTLLRGNPAGVRIWGAEPTVSMADYGIFKARRLPSGEEVKPEDWALARTIREQVTISDELLEIEAFDGEKRVILNYTAPVEDDQGKLLGAIVVNNDITELNQVEQALRESEAYIRTVMDNLPIGVAVNTVDPSVEFSYINENFIKNYRTTREKLAGADAFWEAVYHDPAFREEIRKKVLADSASGDPEKMVWEDIPITRTGEETTYVSAKNTPLPDKDLVISTVWDTTNRVMAERAMRESEQRYRELVTNLPGVVYLCQNDPHYTMTYITAAIEDLTGLPAEAFTSEQVSITDLYHPDDIENIYRDVDKAVARHEPFHLQYRLLHTDGDYRWVEEWGAGVYDNGQLRYLEGFIADITERKEIENALVESEHIFQIALKNSPIMVFQMDRDLRYTRVYNPHKDYDLADQVGKTDHERFSPEDAARLTEIKQRVLDTGVGERAQLETNSDQLAQFVDMTVEPTFSTDGEIIGITCASVDVTAFRLAEEERLRRLAELEALIQITDLLRSARSIDQALPILLTETLSVLGLSAGSIHLYDSAMDALDIFAAAGWFTELALEPLKPGQGITGRVFASGEKYLSEEFLTDPLSSQNVINQIPPGWGGAAVPIQADRETIGVFLVSWEQPYDVDPFKIQLQETIARMAGITLHRMSLLEETLERLEKLNAQRTIDRAVTSLTDLSMTLDIICTQALERLPADAVGVLLFTPHNQTLEYAAAAGFKTDAYKDSRIRLGDGYTGQAALDGQTIHLDDLANLEPPFLRHQALAGEHFSCYTGIPLVSKGDLKGMLEIFHQNHFHHSQEWHNDVQSLATQTAVAIDTLQLYDRLQRNNLQLMQAYDATIEGWSLALDLRDQETEGHSLRVTEQTIQLARVLGISEDDLVHIRRGALLHDMGKLGVPDSILLKPGSLDEEEWAIMRQHPRLAYNMLSQITYLRPALDIPYSHHEKWDGTGYPNQLKGEQIPLAARIFAVVDVYDALTSDRPYRKAWTKKKTLDYIRKESGSHFDPRVVEAFFQIVDQL